jgi:hypothetical protein
LVVFYKITDIGCFLCYSVVLFQLHRLAYITSNEMYLKKYRRGLFEGTIQH